MSEHSGAIARALAMLSHARRGCKRPRALVKDATLQTLVADLVAARAAAGMTQHEVAMKMWTTKSAVSRLESGIHARPTLGTTTTRGRTRDLISDAGSLAFPSFPTSDGKPHAVNDRVRI